MGTAQKASTLLPGLGHLLAGQWIDGLGRLCGVGLLLWSAISGFPRLGALLDPTDGASAALHPAVALLTWVVVAGGLGYDSWRAARPDPAPSVRRRDFLRQFARNRGGVIGLYAVGILILMALLTPLLAPFDPNLLDVGPHRAPPGWDHLMGTDEFGRDLFSRVMYGARISLSIGFVAVGLSATIGSVVGGVAGYYGGRVDAGLMWLVDLLLSLPQLVLLLAIVGFFSGSKDPGAALQIPPFLMIVVVLGLTGWMGVSRIVRVTVLSLREQDFIQACRALGLPTWRILLYHLAPNAMAPIIVYASLAIGSTILVEAALSFLGLGVPPPTPTWGAIVNDGREYMRSAPWITIFPGLMIAAAVMSFNLLGDGLRDALDPKLRGRG